MGAAALKKKKKCSFTKNHAAYRLALGPAEVPSPWAHSPRLQNDVSSCKMFTDYSNRAKLKKKKGRRQNLLSVSAPRSSNSKT